MKKKLLSVLLALSLLTVPAVADVNADAPLSITAEAASTKLAKPTVKSSVKDGKITLSWNKVSGAEAYGVYKYDAGTKKYKKVKITSKTKITISVSKGGTYKYRVYSLDKVDGKYKKGEYAYKKVTVKLDFVSDFMEGIKFGCTEKEFMNSLGGEKKCTRVETAIAGENADGYIIMGNFENGKMESFGKNIPYSDSKLEEILDDFDENGWNMMGDDIAEQFLGDNSYILYSSDNKYISAVTITDDGKFIMVVIQERK